MKAVVIDIDSLRPWNMGCYGYEEDTTPNIDRLAEDSAVFKKAYAAGSPSMPSRAAFLTGRYPVSNGIETHGERGQVLNDPLYWDFERKKSWDGDLKNWWTLPEMLFHRRVQTCAVSSFGRQPAPWFFRLWHEYHQPQEPEGEMKNFSAPRGEEVADKAISFLNEEDEDFFLYTQFWDPHKPYNRPEEEVEQFEGVLLSFPTEEQIETHSGWNTWHSADQLDIDSRDALSNLVARYNAEVNYVDRQVGRIIQELKDRGIYDETMIVVMADHSEEFGEHGLYREHGNVYDTTQRIPLIVKAPGVETGERDELVTNVDIAPTIADYFSKDKPEKWQGRSLKPLVEGEDVDWRDEIVLDHGLYTVQRAIISGKWKLVKTFHPSFWDIPEKQLFNLEEDPWEQEDVSGENENMVEKLDDRMDSWVEERLELDEDPLEKLSETGGAGYRFNRERFSELGKLDDRRS